MGESHTHGLNGYTNYGCRCDTCRAAIRNYTRERRAQRRKAGTPAPEHGLSGYTNYACRCEVCTEAHTLRFREYRAVLKTTQAQSASGENTNNQE